MKVQDPAGPRRGNSYLYACAGHFLDRDLYNSPSADFGIFLSHTTSSSLVAQGLLIDHVMVFCITVSIS